MSSTAPSARKPVLAGLPALSRALTRAGAVVVLGVVGIWLAVNFQHDPGIFIRVMLTGITVGAIYALVALGYTLVYGILELINFAHGDVFMWGGMIAWLIGTQWVGLDGSQDGLVTILGVALALLVAILFCATLNVSIERFAYRPLRNAPRLAPLITAVGVSYALQNLAAVFFTFNYRSGDSVFPVGQIFSVGGLAYRWKDLLVVLITVPVLLLLTWLVRSTRAGKSMRATAQDQEAARMLGIDVDRTISFAFALAGGLAGAGGLLFLFWTTQVKFDTGFQLGLFAFTAAVLGGIGNLAGATLGAFIIGLVQAFNEGLSWNAPGSDWTQSIVFTILILILVFRPEGLLGEKSADRA